MVEYIGIRLLIGTMQEGILPAAPIARWCQSSTPVCLTARCWCESNPGSQFWKAGRYKLAAPVSKTGSAHAEVGAYADIAIMRTCQGTGPVSLAGFIADVCIKVRGFPGTPRGDHLV